jgi:hypothetical protein
MEPYRTPPVGLDQGLMVSPKWLKSVAEPMPNSSMLVLPTTTPPAASSRSTTVAL